MAILKLKSDNKDLSWIINKNPESGLQCRSLRKGKLFSWFKDNEYCVYFKDAQNEISYKAEPDEDFEYLNLSRYTASLVYLDMLSKLFNKPNMDYDKNNSTYTFEIGSVKIKNLKYIDIFGRYFDNKYEIIYTEIAKNTYTLSIKGNNVTFNELYHFTRLFLLFNVIKSDEFFYVEKDVIAKYIKSLEVIDAPYFIRYVFKVNLLRDSMKIFNANKSILEHSNKYKINMQFGDNGVQRQKFLFDHYQFDTQVIDIGCGEGRYGLKIAEKIQPKGLKYIAIDTDKEMRRAVYWKSKSRKLDNIFVLKSFDRFIDLSRHNFTWKKDSRRKNYISYEYKDSFNIDAKESTYLLFEVIEHLDRDSIESLLDTLSIFCQKGSFIIITTPNKEFNKNYFDDEDETRHDDHISEMTKSEFECLIKDCFYDDGFDYKFYDIGDTVDGVSPTQAVVIKRK